MDALATTVREVGAARGVIFSTKGFQSGAITQAKAENIDLFVVRDLSAEEWGLPGRVVDMFLQIVQPSIGNIASPGATKIGNPFNNAPIALNFDIRRRRPGKLNADAESVTVHPAASHWKSISSTPRKKR